MLSPPPCIFAPQPLRKSQRSLISGSRAAFIMVVVPLALTEASIAFSVAPTLGNVSVIFAPESPFFAVQ